MQFREPTEGEQLLYKRIVMLEAEYNKERDRADMLLKACVAARALIGTIDKANPGGFVVGAVLLTIDKAITKAKGE